MKKIKVLFAAAELTPLAKVGGLADVVGALPKALAAHGVDVRVVIPRYSIISLDTLPHRVVAENVTVPFAHTTERVTIIETTLPGSSVPLWLIDHERYLGRDGVYPSPEVVAETTRFSFFSTAVLSLFNAVDWWPDIVHCHDWHTSMIPVLMKILGAKDSRLRGIRTLLTIHNLALQGMQAADELFDQMGISTSDLPQLSQRDSTGTHIIQLVQGILAADRLTTVSPNYAKEIMTPEYGAGLEKIIASRSQALSGILNGIDDVRFDPEDDPDIAYHFSVNDLSDKKNNKQALQTMCGLPVQEHIPTIGIISRLTDQKGIDLVESVGDTLLTKPLQLAVLGAGAKGLELGLQKLAQRHSGNAYVRIGFDAAFAQKIYAGADMFLMPSKFEPCGLGQMIAMRYGTVPIVRATGGLVDTVENIDAAGNGDGICFTQYSGSELLNAVDRALALYQNNKVWHTVVQRIMVKDFSWSASSRKYIDLYRALIEKI